MSEIEPSPNGGNGDGRDRATGRFAPGWKGGPGNPLARRTAKYRRALRKAAPPAEVAAVMRAMIDAAKAGDVAAAKIVLEHTVGKPKTEIDLVAAGEVKFHPITLDGDVDLSEFDDDELMKFERAFSGRSPARPALPPASPAEGL